MADCLLSNAIFSVADVSGWARKDLEPQTEDGGIRGGGLKNARGRGTFVAFIYYDTPYEQSDLSEWWLAADVPGKPVPALDWSVGPGIRRARQVKTYRTSMRQRAVLRVNTGACYVKQEVLTRDPHQLLGRVYARRLSPAFGA